MNNKIKLSADVLHGEEEAREAQILQEREQLLHALSAGKLDRVQERVAWVLNQNPETRDSDVALLLAYWETFNPELASGEYVLKKDLFSLPRLTSLSRARAKIQNTYELFQASPEIRRYRKQMSAEELEKALEQVPAHPLFVVYADESGKTGKYLIVGSLWFLHPPEILSFIREIEKFRSAAKFDKEFHFKDINAGDITIYLAFADWLAAKASVVSFKAVSVERAGLKSVSAALESLFYHLLVRGVEHETVTGRAPLPRRIQLWKDLEEVGADKLFLADLADRLKNAAHTQFANQLAVDTMEATDSKGQVLVQIADLFTSSINRVLNAEGARTSPKDQFADRLLQLLGLPKGPQSKESPGDMTLHVSL